MRLSVRENDLGYHLGSWWARIFVDGIEVKWCFTADEELGEAWCYATNENGVPFLNADMEKLQEECLHGKVEIEFYPPPEYKITRIDPDPCPICNGSTTWKTQDGKTGTWCDPCKSLSLPIEEVLKPVKEDPPAPKPIAEPGQKTSFRSGEWLDPVVWGC